MFSVYVYLPIPDRFPRAEYLGTTTYIPNLCIYIRTVTLPSKLALYRIIRRPDGVFWPRCTYFLSVSLGKS